MSDVSDMLAQYKQSVKGDAGPDPSEPTTDSPVYPYTVPQVKARSHWGVVETVYFYGHGGQAVAPVESRFNHQCDNPDETPCVMPSKTAGPDWAEVKLAWPERIGCLIVTNLGGVPSAGGNPTPEERARLAGLVIELGVSHAAFTVIRPHHSVRIEPVEGLTYFVRCPEGQARFAVAALPA